MSAPQKPSRWGSFLSQAVAGVEARLDNILAEDDPERQQSSRSPPVASSATLPSIPPLPRSATPSRTNDRLQERLARAVAAKNAAQRPENSAGRCSAEITSPGPRLSPGSDALNAASSLHDAAPESSTQAYETHRKPAGSQHTRDDSVRDFSAGTPNGLGASLGENHSPIQETIQDTIQDTIQATIQSESSNKGTRTQEVRGYETVTQASRGTISPGGQSPASSLYEARIRYLEKTLDESQALWQEELHSHVERVDALQAKLQYLAREASESARNVVAASPSGSLEKKIAEKDQQVAQLMEEGQKLANTEQKHRSIIKKLRGQLAVGEKEMNEQKLWRQKAEDELSVLRKRSGEISDLERANEESQKLVNQTRKDVDRWKSEVASRDSVILDLQHQLHEESEHARSMATKMNDQIREAGQQKVQDLEDAISALEVEKNLITNHAEIQAAELREKADRASERSRALELELKGEIQILESNLEALRARAEEASSGAVGDAQAKLLRQIETLQTQHSIASDNWQGMEASLVARASNLERERDEALRRESDMRRKARETANRAKRQEEELEEARSQLPSVRRDLSSNQAQLESLTKRAEKAEATLLEARADYERQRVAWKEERADKADQDRRNWLEDIPPAVFRNNGRPDSPMLSPPQRTFSGEFLGLQNVPARFRKSPAPSSNGEPSPSERPSSAWRPSMQSTVRSSTLPISTTQSAAPPFLPSGLDVLASPPTYPLDGEDVFDTRENAASPQNVLQDVMSVSTTTAGPSVQLVERMSAAIRRLESEKVAGKEELARISSQRDEARGEIVALMKDIGLGKLAIERAKTLEAEVAEINERYQTTLEMLGEKSELVEELRADVQDVKAMYRELVERTVE
ncbi:TATA element modulatory factor 1 TATA binding-domain-containing protein [Xylariomycetidae sp. FL2044]|nr:TATA element modulatory factor 1 TATA binding-domain-containing protein [Xylariomycetidae sp. FL2044]